MTESDRCPVEDRVLWEWVEDGTPPDGLDLEHHVGSCASCAARVADMRRLALGIEALATAEPPPLPDRIGPYLVSRQVGEGGMGVVYEATQVSTGQRVAVKVLRTARAAGASMGRALAREARVLARLDHPGIARILDAGTTEDGRPFIVVEFVEGQPLDRFVRDRELDVRQRAALLARAARAVHHAHQRGVLHCDLKPANILVDEEGAPRIVDFGLARPAIEELGWSLSIARDEVVGTIPYMSPEQARGDVDELDVRTDVYGLGAVAYAALVGEAPRRPDGTLRGRAVGPHSGAAPAHPSSVDRRVPRELGDVVLEALRPIPDERYESAAAFAEDLERFLDGRSVRAREASALYRMRVALRRNKAAAAGIFALIVVLSAAVVTTQRAAREAARQRDEVMGALTLMTETLRRGGRTVSLDGSEAGASDALRAVAARLEAGAVFEPDSLAGATARAEVGRLFRTLYWDEGDPAHGAAALRHTRAALETRRRRLGEDHPDTVLSAYELSDLLTGDNAQWTEGRRLLERIEARHREGRVEPCLGLARTLLELSRRAPLERRERLATEAAAMLRDIDAPPADLLASSTRLAQIAHERGDDEAAARRAAELERERALLGLDDGLALARLTFEPGGRLRVGGPRPGVLFDDAARGDGPRGAQARVGADTVAASTFRRGELSCGSELHFTLDLRPRPEDPGPLVPGANLDATAYAGSLFAPPVDEDPFVDHVHANLRLWKVFDPRRERVELALTLRRAPSLCAWRPTGHQLVFTEPLFVERTGDPDVCVVTTRHPTDAALDADRVDLVRDGEAVATYRIPLAIRVERLR